MVMKHKIAFVSIVAMCDTSSLWVIQQLELVFMHMRIHMTSSVIK